MHNAAATDAERIGSSTSFATYTLKPGKGFEWHPELSRFLESMQATSTRGVIVYEPAVRAIAAQLTVGAPAPQVLSDWIEEAQRHLNAGRRLRRRLLVVQAPHNADAAAATETALAQAFPETDPFELPMAGAQADALLEALAALELRRNERAYDLICELQASSVGLVQEVPPPAESLDRALTAWHGQTVQLAEARTSAAAKAKRLAEFEVRDSERTEALAAAEAATRQMGQTLQDAEATIDELRTGLAAAEANQREARQTDALLLQQISELEHALQEAETSLKTKIGRLAELEQREAEQTGALNAAHAATRQTQQALQDAEATIDELRTGLAAAEANQGETRQADALLLQQISELEHALQEAEQAGALNAAHAATRQTQQTLHDAQTTIGELRTGSVAAQASQHEAQQTSTLLARQVRELEDAFQMIRTRNDSELSEALEAKSVLQQQLGQLEIALQAREEEATRLQDTLNATHRSWSVTAPMRFMIRRIGK